MKNYVVKVDYKRFIFGDAEEAMMFAEACFNHTADDTDDIEISIERVKEDAQED